jgi:hypothetical protein
VGDAIIHNDQNDLAGGHGAIGADAIHKTNNFLT